MTTTIDPAVVQRIAVVIRQAVAEDWIRDLEIGADTSFNDDLEIESIEFVTIAAALQKDFGARVDLMAWLSGRRFEELIELRVGDIAKFVVQTLEQAQGEPWPAS
jgi:acyl carrier protein